MSGTGPCVCDRVCEDGGTHAGQVGRGASGLGAACYRLTGQGHMQGCVSRKHC